MGSPQNIETIMQDPLLREELCFFAMTTPTHQVSQTVCAFLSAAVYYLTNQ